MSDNMTGSVLKVQANEAIELSYIRFILIRQKS